MYRARERQVDTKHLAFYSGNRRALITLLSERQMSDYKSDALIIIMPSSNTRHCWLIANTMPTSPLTPRLSVVSPKPSSSGRSNIY